MSCSLNSIKGNQSKIFGTVNINSLNTHSHSYLNGEKQKWCLKFGQPCASFYYVLTSDQGLTKL